MALMAPNARVPVADGRRAEGTEAVRQLFGDFLAQLRFTTHRITAQWHQEDVWIAEVDASYELRDWLQLNESWYVLNAATSAAGEGLSIA